MNSSRKRLSVFQLLKNGTTFKRTSLSNEKKTNPTQIASRKSSLDNAYQTANVHINNTYYVQAFEQLNLLKFDPNDSLSENEVQFEKGKFRRRESLDKIEQEMIKIQNQKNEKINILKKYHKIKVYGDNIPQPISNFSKMMNKLSLKRELMANIKRAGYLKPTPIQMQAIPAIMQKRNIIGIAPTGSGKTASFAIPILQMLDKHQQNGPRCIIFAPSVELALQLFTELKFFKVKEENELQIQFLKKMNQENLENEFKKVDILICTPLKFLKCLKKHKLNFTKFQFLVLDECDKYFELVSIYFFLSNICQGLISQINQIISLFQKYCKINFLLFSATLHDNVENIFKEIMIDYVKIQIGGHNHVLNSIQQSLSYCSNEYGKIYEIKNMINHGEFTPPVLIFVQSRDRAIQLLNQIRSLKMHVQLKIDCIHGDKTLEEREEIVQNLHNGVIWALICTDVMARGIDFKGINVVINYDFPNQMLTYIHRVGRTGRAGASGRAITFFTDEDKPLLRSLANVLKISGCDVPEWIFELKSLNKQQKKFREKFPVKRESIEGAQPYYNKDKKEEEEFQRRKREKKNRNNM